MKGKLASAIVILAAVNGDKVQLAAGVTKDQTASIKAGDLVKEVGARMGAKGGGKPDMAMAGGGDVQKLPEALEYAVTYVKKILA
jgi:alanyl-tRNA synthetase